MRYNDFVVKVQRAGKEFTAERVASAIRGISSLTGEDMVRVLPKPSTDVGKFADALPISCLREMAIADYYHVEEFRTILCGAVVTVLTNEETDVPTPGNETC